MTQVAGRAGRADKEGEVIIQTYNPSHYAIRFAQQQDYEASMPMRWGFDVSWPIRLFYTVGITLSHKDEEFVVRKSYEVMAYLREHLSDKVTFLGPTPKPIARTHNLYHYQIIIKYRFEDNLEETLNRVLDMTQEPENKDLRLIIDHEPQNFT